MKPSQVDRLRSFSMVVFAAAVVPVFISGIGTVGGLVFDGWFSGWGVLFLSLVPTLVVSGLLMGSDSMSITMPCAMASIGLGIFVPVLSVSLLSGLVLLIVSPVCILLLVQGVAWLVHDVGAMRGSRDA